MSWMRLPKEYTGNDARFVIIPVSYEKDLTYGAGCKDGPAAIIEASEHLEYYDEQFDVEPFVEGIRQLPVADFSAHSPERMVSAVQDLVAKNKGSFIIGLGGDHAITNGFVKGLEGEEDFSVIVLDAHSDFRDSWNGPYNHACVSKNISKDHDMVLVGVRSQDVDEAKQLASSDHVHVIRAYEYDDDVLLTALEHLKSRVYISIDVDVLDPSIISGTGTPEPGGFDWNRLITILRLIFERKTVIGADIVEFSPSNHARAESYTLAKLVYKLMALTCLSQK